MQAKGAGQFASDIKKADGSVDDLKDKLKETDKVNQGTFKKMQASLTTTGSKLKSVGGGMVKAGAAMTAATLPLAIKLKQGISDARDLDTAIRQVTTLSDENILPRAEIEKATKRISNEAGIMQTEIAGAMYDALSSGIKTEDVVGFTEQGLKLTKAGFTDLGTVIDATTTVLNAYGDEALDVAKIQDIMVKTQDLGKITVDELGKSMGRVIPIAAASGVNIDQLGASYSILTAQGFQATDATTGLRSMLSEISATGSKSDKALRQMTGKSFKELTAEGKNVGEVLQMLDSYAQDTGVEIADMFGNLNAGNAALALSQQGVEAYTDTLLQMQNADGAVDANFEKMAGDQLAMDKAKEQMRNAFIDMGKAALPVITQIAEKIGSLAEKFQDLTPHQQKVVAVLGLVAAAAGPVIMVLGGLIAGVGAIATGIGALTAPMLIAGGAIAGLIAGGVALVMNWETVKGKAIEVGQGIKAGFKGGIEETIAGFQRMKDRVGSALDAIKEKWQAVKEFFKNPIKGVVKVAGNIKDKVMGGLPSHATGLDSVPYDNYAANLHKDEMILTAKASKAYRSLGGTKDNLPSLRGISKETITNNASKNIISPQITINIDGQGQEPRSIAREVRAELAKFFQELQLQEV